MYQNNRSILDSIIEYDLTKITDFIIENVKNNNISVKDSFRIKFYGKSYFHNFDIHFVSLSDTDIKIIVPQKTKKALKKYIKDIIKQIRFVGGMIEYTTNQYASRACIYVEIFAIDWYKNSIPGTKMNITRHVCF